LTEGARSLALLVLVFLILLTVSGATFGAWPDDPEINLPVCTADGTQQHPRITTDGASGAIIVWQDISSSSPDIYAQRVDARGEIRWTKDGVAICLEKDRQMLPSLVSDGSGGAIIAWLDRRSGNMDVYAQRVDENGVVLWQPGGMPVCTDPGFQEDFDIAADGAGGAIIAWHDYRAASRSPAIYVQKIDSKGELQWEHNGVIASKRSGYQRYPVIASDDAGGAIIAWHDWRGGEPNIYAQRVGKNGQRLWGENSILVCSLPKQQQYAAITADGVGGAIIAWMDRRNGNMWDVYAQRVTPQGEPQWQEGGVPVCVAEGEQYDYNVLSDGTGGAFITWYDQRSGAWDIYAQRLDASGTARWIEDGLPICIEDNDQYNPNMVSDGVDGIVITWWDRRDASPDIYAQRIDIEGNILWIDGGSIVCAAGGRQQDPYPVNSGVGGAIITWWDMRTVDPDIYVQRIISE